MVEEAGALDVYFEEGIEIVVARQGALEDAVVAEVLADKEIEYTAIRAETL